MSDILPTGAAGDPRDLRCSDSDREKVAEALRSAMADGRIDLDELQERLDRTYAARTYRDLEPVIADLPGGAGVPLPAGRPTPSLRPGADAASIDRLGGVATSGSAVAIMGGSSRKGAWVVPESFTAVAVMGGVELDLTQARFEAAEVVINAVAFWGGIEIMVPLDVAVQVDGVGVMGAFEGPRDDVATQATVRVRVTGVALMGGVEVKRKNGPAERRQLPR